MSEVPKPDVTNLHSSVLAVPRTAFPTERKLWHYEEAVTWDLVLFEKHYNDSIEDVFKGCWVLNRLDKSMTQVRAERVGQN